MNEKDQIHHPILYSFRRCPYAIRARMTILYSGQVVELREVVLRDKPKSMLEYSPKGTVPVLVLESGEVIDESIDVMDWALSINDPDQWKNGRIDHLIDENDFVFKKHLDLYKYAVRFPDHSQEEYREPCEMFLKNIESVLKEQRFLGSDQVSVTDIAIFPFIRQFAFVDKEWFDQSPYLCVQKWLDYFLQHKLFQGVMGKYKPWQAGDEITVFN